jgi:hypothetical protein
MPLSPEAPKLGHSANELSAACHPHHGSQNLHAFDGQFSSACSVLTGQQIGRLVKK